ncbi:Rieske (2Fe-2S) protein [Azospirillum sp. SYSU D00513]|uniref:Rieske (2Fe-2S) protein n=1 Tax=Azospirillum sp. SYSU D00513 TaxID=2812561 RepID=UPI001A97C1E4|nr:Rieske (2Fe-2S) protein [Azospirillum sp. SYSU D00513]
MSEPAADVPGQENHSRESHELRPGGVSLGRVGDYPEGVTPVRRTVGEEELPLLVLRQGGAVRVFRDLCPHVFLPLTYRGPRVLSADGLRLRCTNHGAEFDAETGAPVAGPACEPLMAVTVRLSPDGGIIADLA